ncbi:MAG: nicotinamide-nucleotide amidohydrolase family protein [Clostridia bacterium]|nr:nicotinamide-nucleotide amidohydrolase family protein [Clostridia bacterium]
MIEQAFRVVEILKEKKLTLSTAESCTGGLIAKSITDIAGSSEVFFGGVVSYANEVKHAILGVKNETLVSYGAVSHQTAEEMALGALKACFTDIAVSTTGIAGPGGGTDEKPVGTVYVGFAYKDKASSRLFNFSPSLSRNEIRKMTCRAVLQLLIDELSKI